MTQETQAATTVGDGPVSERGSGAAEAVLDADTVANLFDIMGSDFGQLRGEFEQSSGALVEQLDAAARSGDHRALAEAAHTLKSSTGSMGGKRLRELCRTLERQAEAGHVEAHAEQIARIAHERRRLLDALKAFEC